MAERLFRRTRLADTAVAQALRAETVGGLALIAASVLALIWANSGIADSYFALRDHVLGPQDLHLDLSLGDWAADGLLAIFFFVAGLELKREFTTGDLNSPAKALMPVAAAVGGMVVPAVIFVLINGPSRGWAIPTATDIAFAVAVLAVINSHLPSGLRTFLLTLAVVDDLLAITVIALFYTDSVHFEWLLAAVLPLVAFGWLIRRGVTTWALLLPTALAAWGCVHASGVHATVAGVLLAFAVPVGRIDHFEHGWRPISAGVAVPLFAFFAAGVNVGSPSQFTDSLTSPVALGVIAGLVLGKTIGITGTTWLLARFTRAELDDGLAWIDVVGMALLGGVGFTVSLLIGDLAFGPGSVQADQVKVGVLSGSLLAALLAWSVLRVRNRIYAELDRADG